MVIQYCLNHNYFLNKQISDYSYWKFKNNLDTHYKIHGTYCDSINY